MGIGRGLLGKVYTDTPQASSSATSQTDVSSQNIESDQNDAAQGEVYVTRSGTKYHRDGCSSLRRSKIAISLAEAKQRYGPCGRCNPPQ